MKKVLISNDDGISTPGITLLENIASKFFTDITVIAPNSNRSGASHSLTLASPLRVDEVSKNHYSVSGSPVDCVAFGLRYLFNKNEYPDLVLSGVNSGVNIAEDVIYSGTCGVAREATLFGVPAIALSQQRNKDKSISWEVTNHYAPIILKKIIKNWSFNLGSYLSINFPAVNINEVKGIKVVSQGTREIDDKLVEGVDPRGQPYYWIGNGDYRKYKTSTKYTDDSVLFNGYITIVPLTVDTTDYNGLNSLKDIYDEQYI